MGLVASVCLSRGVLTRWCEAGGHTHLFGYLPRPERDSKTYLNVTFHHPAERPQDIGDDVDHIARALLAKEGYAYKGHVSRLNTDTFRSVLPKHSAHTLLPDLARINAHLDSIGWKPGLEHDQAFQADLTSLICESMHPCVSTP